MLLENGSKFITRAEFEKIQHFSKAPKDYSFDEHLANNLGIISYNHSAIIDALIKIIDEAQLR